MTKTLIKALVYLKLYISAATVCLTPGLTTVVSPLPLDHICIILLDFLSLRKLNRTLYFCSTGLKLPRELWSRELHIEAESWLPPMLSMEKDEINSRAANCDAESGGPRWSTPSVQWKNFSARPLVPLVRSQRECPQEGESKIPQ